jgi:predicted ArsR family transcriptional regulator
VWDSPSTMGETITRNGRPRGWSREEGARHHALAEPKRARILEILAEASTPLDVAELADRLGLHTNTVRWHLGVLIRAGLVTTLLEERTTPGRPRALYAAASVEDGDVGADYAFLATVLAGSLGSLPDGAARAEEAGRAWGSYVVERPPPFTRTSDEEAVAEAVRLLDEAGFEPQAGDDEIELHRCPFRQLAETQGHVVCAVHLGLLRGALAELRSDVTVTELEPFVRPNVCVARLARRESGGRQKLVSD